MAGEYFREYHPRESAQLGEDGLRELIDEGIAKAGSYGIHREGGVGRYVQFMVAIRRDFDTSDETPWTRPIVADRNLTPPEKLERIASVWRGDSPKE